jgi:hypothetical protein
LAESRQDPVVLDPNGGGLVEKRGRDGRLSDGAASRYRASRLDFSCPNSASRARMTACALSATCSLRKMLETWFLTVFRLTNS